MNGTPFADAWRSLEPGFRRGLERAYEALLAGGLPVGAALTDDSGAIVADGRNHAYDPRGGSDVLQRTPLAHAEMNVLARVDVDRSMAASTLWSTQQPCEMCAAAAAFSGVGAVRYLAPDPWAIASPEDPLAVRIALVPTVGPGEDRWVVVANVLFLLGIARTRGIDHPTIGRNRDLEPETTELVDRLAREGSDLPASVEAFTAAIWPDIEPAATARSRRSSRP